MGLDWRWSALETLVSVVCCCYIPVPVHFLTTTTEAAASLVSLVYIHTSAWSITMLYYAYIQPIIQGQTGCSNRTGPISSGVTRNSGAPAQIPKYNPPSLATGPWDPSPIPLPLSPFFSLWLSFAPFSPLPSYSSPLNGVSRFTYFNLWRGGPSGYRTNRPTWQVPGGPVRFCASMHVCIYTGWPEKVSHYQESSLNRIKNCQCGYIFHQFWV